MWVNCFKCLRGICKSGNAGCDTVMGKNCGFCYSDEQWTTSMQRYLAKLVSWSSLDAETEKLGEDIQVHRRRQWHPAPVLLPGKPHGLRSLEGCSPWGRWGSDTTERLHFHFSLSCIGEGNGNPLQCSCLKNPRDSGAWWAAVCWVAQSRTWLKRLSSSSSKASTCHGMLPLIWRSKFIILKIYLYFSSLRSCTLPFHIFMYTLPFAAMAVKNEQIH